MSIIACVRGAAVVASVLAVVLPAPVALAARPSATTQVFPPWSIDRLDQGWLLPYDASYTYRESGVGVVAYVLDSGIIPSHHEIRGRVTEGVAGLGGGKGRCDDHGTSVSSVLGGATVGIAKGVSIVSVKVWQCPEAPEAVDRIKALNWIADNHDRNIPAVVNLSHAARGVNAALDAAVARVVAANISVVVAAGNDYSPLSSSARDACGSSPGRVPEALTVGATNQFDGLAYWSYRGPCVDILAPGMLVPSADGLADWLVLPDFGTSLSAGLVSGAVAIILQRTPKATPAQVAQELQEKALKDRIWFVPAGTPNRLVQISK